MSSDEPTKYEVSVKNLTSLDVTAPIHVEIVIRSDGTVIWVNIDGICRLRACRITKLTLNDERTPAERYNTQGFGNDEAVNPDGTTYDP